MGEIRTSLEKISHKYNNYLFLIGDYEIDAPVNNFFNHNFKKIGSDIDENAVIVRRTDKSRIERELNTIYRELFCSDSLENKRMALFFEQAFRNENKPGLLLTNHHPSNLRADSKIAYISFSVLEDIYKDKNELLRDIINLAQYNDYSILKKTAPKRKIVKGVGVSVNLGVVSFNIDF
jgi:hypothetical protein